MAQVRQQDAFNHAAYEDVYRRRVRALQARNAAAVADGVDGVADVRRVGRAEAQMPPSDAADLPRCTDDKSFDHAAFEAARPRQYGYDLRELSGPSLGAEGFLPMNAGVPCNDLNAAQCVEGFDAVGAGYSDLRSAYQPDLQHLMAPPVERTLEQLVAERARLKPRTKPAGE